VRVTVGIGCRPITSATSLMSSRIRPSPPRGNPVPATVESRTNRSGRAERRASRRLRGRRDEPVALRATKHIQGVPPSCRAEERRRAPADASRTRPSRSPTAASSQPEHRVAVVSAAIATPLEQSPRRLDFVWRSFSSAATPFVRMSGRQTAPTTRPSSVCSTMKQNHPHGKAWTRRTRTHRSRNWARDRLCHDSGITECERNDQRSNNPFT